jgi:hypothetical protein
VSSVVNRYYDPTSDQFMSIDPDVATTDQPYVFTNDNPLNSTDPLGMSLWSKAKQYASDLLHFSAAVNLAREGDLSGAAKILHKTLGGCVGGSAGWGPGISGSLCAGVTANGKPFASLTGGAGGASPQLSLMFSFMASNAKDANQLGRLFTYAGGAAGEGLSVGVDGAVGKSKNNKNVGVGSVSIGFGLGIPLSFQSGASWTYSTNRW